MKLESQIVVLSAGLAVSFLTSITAGAPRFQMIAERGQIVEGAPVERPFNSLVNGVGDVAFVANALGGYSSDQASSVYRYQSGVLSRVAGAGSGAAGLPSGVTFAPTQLTSFNRAGDMLMTAKLSGQGVSSANDTALIHFGSGGARLLAREGDAYAGSTLSHFDYFGEASAISATQPGANKRDFPALSDSGQIAFAARLNNNNDVLLAGRSNSLAVAVSPSTSVPGQVDLDGNPVAATFLRFINNPLNGMNNIDIHPDDSITFSAQHTLPATPRRGSVIGMWRYKDGVVTPVLTNATLREFGQELTPSAFNVFRANSSGNVAMRAFLGPVTGQFVVTPSDLIQLGVNGDTVEGHAGTTHYNVVSSKSSRLFSQYGDEVIDVVGFFDNPNRALVLSDANGRKALLSEGTTFELGGQSFTLGHAGYPVRNNLGQLLVHTLGGLIFTGSGDGLDPILYPGMPIDFEDGGIAIFSNSYAFDSLSSGWDAGRLRLNDFGQSPLLMSFEDGRFGVVLVTIPEPTASMIVFGSLLLICRRRPVPASD